MNNKELVLIVEDEGSIADTLNYVLSKEGFATKIVTTGAAAAVEVSKTSPVAVILDVGLPDLSGFEVCKKIRAISAVPIIFLTARTDEVDKIIGLEIGADDYISKPFSPRELVARLKAILRRTSSKPEVAQDSTKFQNFEIDSERMIISFKGQPLALSRYEFRILSLLLRRPGRVYSREELMGMLWESPEMSLERTIDTHIKTIRAKLKAIDTQDSSIITHRGFGYSLSEA